MYCTKCGQKNSDESKYCEACFAALHERNRQPGAAPTKTGYGLAGVGLVGGILTVIGVFAPWLTWTEPQQRQSVSTWDMMMRATDAGWEAFPTGLSYLVVFGAVLTCGGALFCLAAPANKAGRLVLATGGVFAVLAAALGLCFATVGNTLDPRYGFGWGILLTFAGGCLGLVGSSGLKARP